METIDAVLTLISDNPMLSALAASLAASVWPVWKALMAMVQRRIDQQWSDHGDDDDTEIKIQRVTDLTQAGSLASMLPRGVVESRVRKLRDSDHPEV